MYRAPIVDVPPTSRRKRPIVVTTGSSRVADRENWLPGIRMLFVRSCATRSPRALPPSLPVTLAPAVGSAIERVNTARIGVPKKSAPSRKKGRFSGKKRANRLFTSSWAASASTWEKSGLAVRFRVRSDVMPHCASSPTSRVIGSATMPSLGEGRTSLRALVKVGVSWRLAPGVPPRIPVTRFAWQSTHESSRSQRALRSSVLALRGHQRVR